jgi:hypothetical protein
MHAAKDPVLHTAGVCTLDEHRDAPILLAMHIVDHGFGGTSGHFVGIVAACITGRDVLLK